MTASESDDARRLAGLILLRALISSALFGASVLTNFNGSLDEATSRGGLFVYLAAAYASAAAEFLWVLSGSRLARLALLHAGVEAALAAWLIGLTGGAESPFTFLLLIATVLGAVAAGSSGAFVAATLASGSLLTMVVGIPIAGFAAPTHVDARIVAVVLASGGGCFATAALASYLTQRLQRAGRALSAREAELRNLGELYLKVAQSLRSGLMTLGPASAGHPSSAAITLLNEPGAHILGVSAKTVQGMALAQAVPELARAVDAHLGGGPRAECAIRQGTRNVLVGFSVSPLKGDLGTRADESPGSVLTFQDLTEQRKIEEVLRRQTHLASLGELAAGLAHEVRNPLAAISGAAQMLQQFESQTAPGGSDDRKLFDVIQRESLHLESLVSDFLTFARPPTPALQDNDLAELARTTFEAFRATEQTGERRLSCEVTDVSAIFDPGQLRQVIWNLLRNALEATSLQGHIALAVHATGGNALLQVSDDGPGIPTELRDRIFEPFFTTKERGTGLGLALVGRIVGAHAGTIEVDADDFGTRFTITLPRATESAQAVGTVG